MRVAGVVGALLTLACGAAGEEASAERGGQPAGSPPQLATMTAATSMEVVSPASMGNTAGASATSEAANGTERAADTAAPPAEPARAPTSDGAGELERLRSLDGRVSRSVGGPNDGALEGGVALPLRGPGFRFNPRRNPEARYATVEVVQQLVAAAGVVHRELPGGELTINDLSLPRGGPIPHHGSHRAGRDADVLFYLLGPDGQPHPSVGAPLDPEGRGTDYGDLADPRDDVPLRIDLPRTWRFVQALIEASPDDGAPLQRIFVAEHLRALLLRYAREHDAPEAATERFAMLTCQPSYPHDDHLHLRWFCSPDDLAAGCEDTRPHYPWRRDALRRLGLQLRLHRPRPDRPQAPITTSAQARAAAGPMHPQVRRFLRRRHQWMDPPHPGRPYCR